MPNGKIFSALAFVAVLGAVHAAEDSGVTVIRTNDRVRIEINGQHFTDYWYKGNQHPALSKDKSGNSVTNPTRHVYFYPLIGPHGINMTRSWPMDPGVAGEETDHPHHRSLWFSHGAVNGVDFWAETGKAGKIQHAGFAEVKSGKDDGVIISSNRWVAPDNTVVCTDERVFRVYNRPANERLVDFEVTIKAPANRDVLFGDTKEGTMAIRVNEQMRVTRGKKEPGTGHIVLSTGVRDDAPLSKGAQTWGKRAEWCDYWGTVDGKQVGIAIFNHPSNPVHPTYWHVRDYGLFAANPFGIHDFEKKPPGTGNLNIPAGQSVTFKYRIYIHEGDEKKAKVAERYQDYVSQKK